MGEREKEGRREDYVILACKCNTFTCNITTLTNYERESGKEGEAREIGRKGEGIDVWKG